MISSPSMLDALENESIEIFRETATAFAMPGVESDASSIEQVVKEVTETKLSAQATGLLDGEKEDSMEKKKTEGCF